LSITTDLNYINGGSLYGQIQQNYTIVINGCCYFVEGFSATYGPPNFSGVDGYYSPALFSADTCETCIGPNPCANYIYTLQSCGCCGTSGNYEINFGCNNGFNPNSIQNRYISI